MPAAAPITTAGPHPTRGPTLHFTPSPEAEVALLCRILHRAGFDEKHYGHISYAQDDGTIVFTAWEVPWWETCASDVLRLDADGNLLEGRGTVTPAVALHLAIHRHRPEVRVAVHHHPRWSTIWAARGEIPPPYCQTGSQVGRIGLYDEYEDTVADPEVAVRNVAALDGCDAGLLANHGVLVFGSSPRRALERCIALETRARVAWHVEALGGGRPMPDAAVDRMVAAIEGNVSGPRFHHAAIRREVLADPHVLL